VNPVSTNEAIALLQGTPADSSDMKRLAFDAGCILCKRLRDVRRQAVRLDNVTIVLQASGQELE
jgi:hypothetical protein